MILAITGGTGFVGSHLMGQAVAAGHRVRALTRRPQAERSGVTWIAGALDQPAALDRLVEGAEAVVHVAGVISGSGEAFRLGNLVGTQNMVGAAMRAGVGRFVHVSSLAARLPDLSRYGASKLAAEAPVIADAPGWTILRPPAIYGPGDHELIDLFRLAKWGLVPVPAGGRLSAIHVADLCRLLLACVTEPAATHGLYEPDDGREGGWTKRAFGRAIARAVGRPAIVLPLPKPLLVAGSAIDRAIRGKAAKLTPDRVAYFTHPDWAVRPEARPPASLWRPQVDTQEGLTETARWYRDAGWL